MSAPPTATPPPGEGCPTPLAWEQVLATFRDERDEFELRTSWGNVSVWEYGTGSPLVFIGGPGGRGDLFALTCYLLRDDYRSIIIQLPNAPRRVPVEQRPAGWGHLVQQAIGARQHGRVPLFAADWGARVALQLAIDAPDSLTRLILLGCPLDVSWSWGERLLMGVFGGSSRKLATVPGWDRIARSNHLPWFPPFDSGRWEFLRGQLAEATLETTIQHLRSPLPAESRARLAAVRQPTLLIGTEGEASATTTGQQWLAEQLPNARYETMHSSGLFPHVTHPHRLVKLLRSFLLEEAAGDVPKTAPSTPQPATTD